eukprot:CAMPEP_0113873174 /NCGR_PEP_ID=MMETSP0780_2-20120614/3622_1 /TAXON_ID=652834 /ORGANISM="Palpitomonas bilix" /LENGTH=1290 /DNA_ID=CAMNT_0000858787 /DNA_START=105 /DNA_END=3977 /DNA_ORIENTATION=- /assembly_acc=CAM_ASM_000599
MTSFCESQRNPNWTTSQSWVSSTFVKSILVHQKTGYIILIKREGEKRLEKEVWVRRTGDRGKDTGFPEKTVKQASTASSDSFVSGYPRSRSFDSLFVKIQTLNVDEMFKWMSNPNDARTFKQMICERWDAAWITLLHQPTGRMVDLNDEGKYGIVWELVRPPPCSEFDSPDPPEEAQRKESPSLRYEFTTFFVSDVNRKGEKYLFLEDEPSHLRLFQDIDTFKTLPEKQIPFVMFHEPSGDLIFALEDKRLRVFVKSPRRRKRTGDSTDLKRPKTKKADPFTTTDHLFNTNYVLNLHHDASFGCSDGKPTVSPSLGIDVSQGPLTGSVFLGNREDLQLVWLQKTYSPSFHSSRLEVVQHFPHFPQTFVLDEKDERTLFVLDGDQGDADHQGKEEKEGKLNDQEKRKPVIRYKETDRLFVYLWRVSEGTRESLKEDSCMPYRNLFACLCKFPFGSATEQPGPFRSVIWEHAWNGHIIGKKRESRHLHPHKKHLHTQASVRGSDRSIQRQEAEEAEERDISTREITSQVEETVWETWLTEEGKHPCLWTNGLFFEENVQQRYVVKCVPEMYPALVSSRRTKACEHTSENLHHQTPTLPSLLFCTSPVRQVHMKSLHALGAPRHLRSILLVEQEASPPPIGGNFLFRLWTHADDQLLLSSNDAEQGPFRQETTGMLDLPSSLWEPEHPTEALGKEEGLCKTERHTLMDSRAFRDNTQKAWCNAFVSVARFLSPFEQAVPFLEGPFVSSGTTEPSDVSPKGTVSLQESMRYIETQWKQIRSYTETLAHFQHKEKVPWEQSIEGRMERWRQGKARFQRRENAVEEHGAQDEVLSTRSFENDVRQSLGESAYLHTAPLRELFLLSPEVVRETLKMELAWERRRQLCEGRGSAVVSEKDQSSFWVSGSSAVTTKKIPSSPPTLFRDAAQTQFQTVRPLRELPSATGDGSGSPPSTSLLRAQPHPQSEQPSAGIWLETENEKMLFFWDSHVWLPLRAKATRFCVGKAALEIPWDAKLWRSGTDARSKDAPAHLCPHRDQRTERTEEELCLREQGERASAHKDTDRPIPKEEREDHFSLLPLPHIHILKDAFHRQIYRRVERLFQWSEECRVDWLQIVDQDMLDVCVSDERVIPALVCSRRDLEIVQQWKNKTMFTLDIMQRLIKGFQDQQEGPSRKQNTDQRGRPTEKGRGPQAFEEWMRCSLPSCWSSLSSARPEFAEGALWGRAHLRENDGGEQGSETSQEKQQRNETCSPSLWEQWKEDVYELDTANNLLPFCECSVLRSWLYQTLLSYDRCLDE